jgi:hypothetical protein
MKGIQHYSIVEINVPLDNTIKVSKARSGNVALLSKQSPDCLSMFRVIKQFEDDTPHMVNITDSRHCRCFIAR